MYAHLRLMPCHMVGLNDFTKVKALSAEPVELGEPLGGDVSPPGCCTTVLVGGSTPQY